ncbi:hypothetical protein D3C87_1386610 [compost metagenome]
MKFSKAILPLVISAFFAGSAFAANPTDPEIAEILKTANDGEMKVAKVAKSHAENKDVQDFAKMMIESHKKNEKEGKEVFKKAKIKPKSNETAKLMKKETEAKIKELKAQKKNSAEFDRAYIESQIAMHQQLLNDLDATLIPNAKSEDLKTYLTETRNHVQEHLTKAQQIQTSMMK